MTDTSRARRRVFLGPASFLPARGFVAVPITPPHELPDTTFARSALVGHAGGQLRAYANLCRHLAIALDYGDGDVSDEGDEESLLCRRHGAAFDGSSGVCTAGPCLGRYLWRLDIEVDALGDAELVLGGEIER